mgnify:CR=1 FL=1
MKILPWDSDFFNLTIAQLEEQEIAPVKKEEIVQWAKDNHVDVIQCKCRKDDVVSVRKLESMGFVFEDERITLRKKISSSVAFPAGVEEWKEDFLDVDDCIAPLVEYSRYRGITDSRKIHAFYHTWYRKALKGEFDHICYVCRNSNRCLGFITLRMRETACSIGLISVSASAQRRGIGSLLIEAAAYYAFRQGATELTVVTEGKNKQALRFYEKNAFEIILTEAWYYYKPEKNADSF